MMHFDLTTAMTVTSLLTLCVGASLTFAASRYPADLRGAMRVWVGGLFLQTLMLLGIAVAGASPGAALIVAINSLYALAFVEMGRALSIFAGRPQGWLPLLLVGGVALSSILFGLVWPHPQWRIAMNAIPLALLQLAVAGKALGKGGTRRPADWLTGALFLACAVLALSRGAAEIIGPALLPHLDVVMAHIVYVFSAILPTIGTIGFMLMCGDRLNDDLAQLAMVDPLTGAYNRRTLTALAGTAIATARRDGRHLSLLALDIDHFKRINDKFGHDAGDDALIGVVALLRESLGQGQVLSRIGGEEFVILLPDTDAGAAFHLAERLRRRVAEATIPVRGGLLDLQISVGTATLDDDNADLPSLLRRADRALYAAKRAGRNRVAAAPPPSSPALTSFDTVE